MIAVAAVAIVAAFLAARGYAVHLCVEGERAVRRNRAAWKALEDARREHVWTGWVPLDEPGISEVDHGAWQRARVTCEVCGEQRDVWRHIPRDTRMLLVGCPGPVT